MNLLRIAVRLPAVVLVTAALSAVHLLLVPATRRVGISRKAARVSSALFRLWARALSTVLGLSIDVEGSLPRPPFVLVSNHLGYVDVVVLGSLLRCVFVSMAEVERWPLLGPACRSVGTIFIDRSAKRQIPRVLGQMETELENGRGVVIFPEGQASDGSTVLPFRPALLEIAARGGLPVSWASLAYETPAGAEPAAKVVCWGDRTPFFRHAVRLLGQPSVRARVRFGKDAFWDADRKVLTTQLWNAVRDGFRPPAPRRSPVEGWPDP